MPNLLKQIRWRKLASKTATVVAAEVLLNAAGLDTIANYAEFINEHRTTLMEVVTTVITTWS
jgi:precorrin-4 methylase